MMKKGSLQNIYLIGLSLFCLYFSSCYSMYNVKSPQHTLHIEEAQDLKCSSSLSSNIGMIGVHGQIGYSPIKHVAISASGTLTTSTSTYHEKAYELALGGYFLKRELSSSSLNKNSILFDLYAGYGRGNMRRLKQYQNSFSDISCRKYFIQPGICFQGSSHLLSISLRTGILDYDNLVLVGPYSWRDYDELYEVIVNDAYIYTDLMWKIEGNISNLHFFSAMQFKYIPKATFEYGNYKVYFGVAVDLNDLLKKNN